jgi:hypothetical protein
MNITKAELRQIVLEEINNVLYEESLSNEEIESIIEVFNSGNPEVGINLLEPMLIDEDPQFVYSVISQVSQEVNTNHYDFLSALHDSDLEIDITDFVENHLNDPLQDEDLELLAKLKSELGVNIDEFIQGPSVGMDRILDVIPELKSVPSELEYSKDAKSHILFKKFSGAESFLYAQYAPELEYLYISIDTEPLILSAETMPDGRWNLEVEDPNSNSLVEHDVITDEELNKYIHGRMFGDFIDRNFDSEEEESEY